VQSRSQYRFGGSAIRRSSNSSSKLFLSQLLEERVSDRAGLSMKGCYVPALMAESGYFLTIPSFADGVSM